MAGLLAGREAGGARPLFFFVRDLAVFGQQLLLKRIKKNQRNSGVWALTGTCSLVAACWLPPAGGKLACWLATGSAEWLAGLTAHCLLWMGTYLFDPLRKSTGHWWTGCLAVDGKPETDIFFFPDFFHERNKTRLIGRPHIYICIYVYTYTYMY